MSAVGHPVPYAYTRTYLHTTYAYMCIYVYACVQVDVTYVFTHAGIKVHWLLRAEGQGWTSTSVILSRSECGTLTRNEKDYLFFVPRKTYQPGRSIFSRGSGEPVDDMLRCAHGVNGEGLAVLQEVRVLRFCTGIQRIARSLGS